MATAFIYSRNQHLTGICRAYLEVYGHSVVESGPVDVAIIDLDGLQAPDIEARILVCLSAREYRCSELPMGTLFRLKPVDIDGLMDCILDMLKLTV